MDVLTGAFVGMYFAIITLMVIADVFNKRSAFWRPMDRENSQENHATHKASFNVPISPYNNTIMNMNQQAPFPMMDGNINIQERHTLKTKM